MEKNNYTIYKAENMSNGEVYIGATTKSLDARQKDHIERANRGDSGRFQSAIATFGSEFFDWIQLDTAISSDQLAKKEKEYILQYDSKENGYNVDCGGGVRKTVYQYDVITGALVGKHPNLSVAGAVVGLTKQGLSNVCLSVNKTCKGFYWTYDYIDRFLPLKDLRRKKVQQFNLEGKFINEFNSVSEASKITGCNKSSIAKVCRFERKTAGGYLWR